MIQRGRRTAWLDGDFVVFMIGMRVNQPWRVDRWWPVASSMAPMLRELARRPELGLLSVETWFSRTIVAVQYWRSMAQLLAYATDRDSHHLPAWQAFNRAARDGSGAVGIWHETYVCGPGRYESVYVDMPPFGLGRAGRLVVAAGHLVGAAGRLDAMPANDSPTPP